ncbi:MAG: acyl-CoA dehydrogenase family protein [Micromonosporaceae bacterium]
MEGPAPVTGLLYSDVENELRASLRGMLAQRSPWRHVLSWSESGQAMDASLWRALAGEMGLAGMAIPEKYGGGGASLSEAAVVLEELGRAVAPVPFLGSAVVATSALLACRDAELLTKLATGEAVAALAVPLGAGPSPAPVTVRAEGGKLHGTVGLVADALAADVLLVPADGGLYAVDARAFGVMVERVVSLDMTRPLADLTFDAVPGRLVAAGEAAASAMGAARTAGAALLASEQLGVAEWCLESTVEYLKLRHQFGRPVGSFQALKHRLADLWVDVTQARAAARYAAACAATGDDDLPVATSLAQAFCSPVAVKAAEECVQLHGGIGFTWEHPAHLYFKRAKSSELLFGDPTYHRELLAQRIGL